MDKIVTVDPGKNGGLVIKNGSDIVGVGMPDTVHDLKNLFLDFQKMGIKTVVIEKVTGFIRVFGRPQNAHTASVLMKNVGWLEGLCAAFEMRLEEVRPQVWQLAVGISKKTGEEQYAWKSRLKSLAQKLYPSHKVTRENADAFLLLEYSQRNSKLK